MLHRAVRFRDPLPATAFGRASVIAIRWCAVAMLSYMSAAAQAQDAGKKEQQAAKRLAFMKESVSSVDLAWGEEPDSKLTLHPEHVLRWNNLVSGIEDGAVFVWTRNGRPETAVQVFKIPDGRWLQESQSLSTRPLIASHGSRLFWSPTPGVTMMPLDGALKPSKSRASRLVQMRSIAREFRAVDIFQETERYDLRLLPQPLIEYGDPDVDLVHGGLFAFVHGTDPEVLLLIEAHQSGAELVWQVGFAPLTSYECLVSRKDAAFWTCARRPPPNRRSDPFFLHVYETADSP